MSGALQAVFQNQRSFGPPPGQDAYTSQGTYTFVAPAGVTSVSVVAVGGGGGGGACPSSVCGTQSYFVSTGVVRGGAGRRGCGSLAFATFTGDGGGNGGKGSQCGWNGYGGGGAGGYSGAGGNSSQCPSGNGYSGSGGGGGGATKENDSKTAGGGGVGIFGEGASGAGGTRAGGASYTGKGGSGGCNGGPAVSIRGGPGGYYGGGGGYYSGSAAGGGGGLGYKNNYTVTPLGSYTVVVGKGGTGKTVCACDNVGGGDGGSGAVRVIYPGTTRSFPSTCTGDL